MDPRSLLALGLSGGLLVTVLVTAQQVAQPDGRVAPMPTCASGQHLTHDSGTWSCTADAGGGSGAPTDATYLTQVASTTLSAEQAMGALASGLVVNATTTGVQSIYGGTSCTNQFPRSLNASGAAACADVTDADVLNTITLDNLTQVTTRAIADTTGTLAAGRGGTNLTAATADAVMVGSSTTWQAEVLPSCAGATTDKLLYNATTNTFSCGSDQGGSGVAFREFYLCAPGNSSAAQCMIFTNQGAAFTEVSNNASRDHLDLSGFTDFRILIVYGAAAVTADLRIECDTDAAFGSPTTLTTLNNPVTGLTLGAWTTLPADECTTTAGQYLRAGMLNGNTTEDPVLRVLRLQVK